MAGAPLRALRGFERVHLEPGASKTVRFELKPRDMSMVTEAGEPIVAEGKYTVISGRRAAGYRSAGGDGDFHREGNAGAAGINRCKRAKWGAFGQ